MKPENITAALKGMKRRKDHSKFFRYNRSFPKMWIVGKKDPLIDLDKVRDLATDCKDTDYIELSEGHMSYVENSKDMPLAIRRFLERNKL
jgi:hypothetical protein